MMNEQMPKQAKQRRFNIAFDNGKIAVKYGSYIFVVGYQLAHKFQDIGPYRVALINYAACILRLCRVRVQCTGEYGTVTTVLEYFYKDSSTFVPDDWHKDF